MDKHNTFSDRAHSEAQPIDYLHNLLAHRHLSLIHVEQRKSHATSARAFQPLIFHGLDHKVGPSHLQRKCKD